MKARSQRTPSEQIFARGIDTTWTALHRRDAQGHLADARQARWRAEWYLEIAARELAEGGKHSERVASDYVDLAFRVLDGAWGDYRRAKESALLATRGTPLDGWIGKTAGRAARRRYILENPISFRRSA